jgi:hypothetical protein
MRKGNRAMKEFAPSMGKRYKPLFPIFSGTTQTKCNYQPFFTIFLQKVIS